MIYARLAEEAALTIGVVEGREAYLFQRIVSVARDGEGNLVVADAGWYQVRTFNANGNHLRTVGREGEGPGDFVDLKGAWPRSGGGVIAVDGFLQTVSEYGPTGELERVAKLRDAGSPLSYRSWGVDGSESLLGSATNRTTRGLSPGDTARSPVHLVRHGLDGAIPGHVVAVPGCSRGCGRFRRRHHPHGESSVLGVPGGGRWRGRCRDHGRRIIRDPLLRSGRVSAAHRQARGSAPRPDRGTPEGPGAGRPGCAALYEQLPLPATLPGYVKLVFADTGEIWARRYLVPGTPSFRWDVLHPDGHYLGRVEIAASFRVHAVSNGQLLGVHEDALGVERVQVRDLEWGGGEEPRD